MSLQLQGPCPLLQVFDMPIAIRFYTEVMGFEIVSRSPTYATEQGTELFHWAWLRRANAEVMLSTAYDEGERPDRPEPARVAAHHDTGLFFFCPDLDAAYTHLQAHGIACRPPNTTHYAMRQLGFRDPDGYGITLQHPVGGSTTSSS